MGGDRMDDDDYRKANRIWVGIMIAAIGLMLIMGICMLAIMY